MGFQVVVDFTGPGGTRNVAQDSTTWTGVPEPLSGSTVVTNTAPNGSTGETFANGSSTWAPDGNSGTVTIDYGWSANTHDFTSGFAAGGAIDPLYSHNWSYTFVADQTGLFVMNANVVGTGSSDDPSIASPMFGLLGFDIIGSDFFPLGVNFTDPTASGQITQMLLAGNTYTMVIRNASNIYGGVGDRDASVHATFDWTLPGAAPAGVPDTASTLALMTGGLAALAGLRHRWGLRVRVELPRA